MKQLLWIFTEAYFFCLSKIASDDIITKGLQQHNSDIFVGGFS